MRSIQQVVERILIRDADIKEKMRKRLINLSAYAKTIQKDVEERAMKNTSIESIIIALSRTQRDLGIAPKTESIVVVSQLSVRSPIVEYVYDKNEASLIGLGKSIKIASNVSSDTFFSVSTSTRDIALIMSESIAKDIALLFQKRPKVKKTDLVAISVRFHESLVSEPNIGTRFMQSLGVRGVVLDEVVSAFNEFTIVCHRKYLDDAMEVLHAFQK